MTFKLVFFRDISGTVQLLEWLDELPEKALVKCLHRLNRLAENGHRLRRPEADYLRDGIYELRVRHLNVNYRMLYFFEGVTIAVVSHGIIKEDIIPSREIDRAILRMKLFKANPKKHYAEG